MSITTIKRKGGHGFRLATRGWENKKPTVSAISKLQGLGLTEAEARAYLSLLRFGSLTGYELARRAGIPRPNIYPVLRRLEDRGAVARAESPEGTRYRAVSPRAFLSGTALRLKRSLKEAGDALAAIAAPLETEEVWNLTGRGAVLGHARQLWASARRTITLALWPREAGELAEAMARSNKRGVSISTLCLNACSPACEGCRGTVYPYGIGPGSETRWLVIVVDEKELLAAELGIEEEGRGIRTRQGVVVGLALEYLRHSIALAELLKRGALEESQLRTLSTPQRRWLETLQRRVAVTQKS